MRGRSAKAKYHHGDLRAALVDTAVALIAERGLHGFSLAEASRRLGVTVAAPYRHFADRDELLAAVATRAAERLGAALSAGLEPTVPAPPEERVVAGAAAYVRFAAEERPLFETLFSAGLDKHHYPELEAISERAGEPLIAVARELSGSDEEAETLLLAVITASHGTAALLLDGFFGRPVNDPAVIATAVAHATSVSRAVLAGRFALNGS
jgi:AcrR family transcriptional regulator